MTAAEWVIPVVTYGRVLPEPTAAAAPRAAGLGEAGVKSTPPAPLMHRAFGIDMLACPHCGGRLRLIATLHDPVVIRKILAHLALSHSGRVPAPPHPRPVPPHPDRLGRAADTVVPVPRGGIRADSAGPPAD